MILVNKKSTLQPGMTIWEVLAVLVIMAIFASFAIPAFRDNRERARVQKAKNDLQVLETAIIAFNMDTNKDPESLEDLVRPPMDDRLKERWKPSGYLKRKELPVDPWENEYVYKRTPGQVNPYELFSYGANGEDAPESEWIFV